MPGAISGTTKSTEAMAPHLAAAEIQSARDLEDALNLLARYGDEYMDEMPLVGEPGAFIFSKNPAATAPGTTAGADQAASNTLQVRQQSGRPASRAPTPGRAIPPPGLKTDPSSLGAGKKADKSGEHTPNTPGTPVGSAGGKEKKRKKSKAGLAASAS
jgi:mediator of RNA polymerase II transcription subunit 6